MFLPMQDLLNYRESMRKFFEPSGKIPIEKLEEVLSRYKDTKGEEVWYLVPVKAKQPVEDSRLWLIKRMTLSVEKTSIGKYRLKDFVEIVRKIAGESGLHPALVTSFFISELPEQHNEVWVFSENGKVIIDVSSINLSVHIINKILRGMQGKTGRGQSKRTKNLLEFQQEYFTVDAVMFKIWNRIHPEWKYKNLESMRVVVSRLTKKQIKEPLSIYIQILSAGIKILKEGRE
jgi:hypothetical protein